MMVDGNYVRVKISSATEEEIRKMREGFTALGAKGVIIHAIRDTKIVARSGSTVKAGASIEASVFEFIKARKIEDIEAQVIAGAEEVLQKRGTQHEVPRSHHRELPGDQASRCPSRRTRLVLIQGDNEDDHSADSNGSGEVLAGRRAAVVLVRHDGSRSLG